MLSQVESKLHNYQVINKISDHSTDGSSLKRMNGFIRSRGGNLHPKKTNRGWKLEVKWKYESLIWIPLKAEYEVSNNI